MSKMSKTPLTRSQGSLQLLLLLQQENLSALATQSARGVALLTQPSTRPPTSTQVQRKISALESLWLECDRTHRELLVSSSETDVAAYIADGSLATARRELYILIEQLEGVLGTVPDQAPVNPSATDHPSQLRPVMSTLERIPVPTFEGALKDWPNFREMFTALVINDNSISPIHKLVYLKKSLKGNALSIIKNQEVSDANFTRAWKLVTDHYQNVNSLTFSHIVRLLKLEPADPKRPGQLERLFLQTREILASLELLIEPVEQWSSLLVVLTLLRLDSDIRQDWEHSIGKNDFPYI